MFRDEADVDNGGDLSVTRADCRDVLEEALACIFALARSGMVPMCERSYNYVFGQRDVVSETGLVRDAVLIIDAKQDSV